MEELTGHKLTVWDVQPVVIRAWQQAGIDIVTLPITDGMIALQSGMINAFLSTPLTAAAFQWFALAPYMNDLKFAPMYAAVVVTERIWDRVPEDLKPAMLESARAAARELTTNAAPARRAGGGGNEYLRPDGHSRRRPVSRRTGLPWPGAYRRSWSAPTSTRPPSIAWWRQPDGSRRTPGHLNASSPASARPNPSTAPSGGVQWRAIRAWGAMSWKVR